MQRAGHETYDGGLARAVGAEEHGHRAGRHHEGEVAHRHHVAEGAPDASERDGLAGSSTGHGDGFGVYTGQVKG